MNEKPLRILTDLLKTYGLELCNDPRRVEALLKDLCPECKVENYVLVSANQEQIPQELIASSSIPFEITSVRLAKRLQDNRMMQEEATRWAVSGWMIVLGLSPLPTPETTEKPPSFLNTSPAATIQSDKYSGIIRDGFIIESHAVADSRTGLYKGPNSEESKPLSLRWWIFRRKRPVTLA